MTQVSGFGWSPVGVRGIAIGRFVVDQEQKGGYSRLTEPNETNVLNATPSATIIYAVQGYDEPFGFVVGSNNPIFARIDRRATALGGTLEFSAVSERTTPLSVVAMRLQPAGERTGWSVSLGVRP